MKTVRKVLSGSTSIGRNLSSLPGRPQSYSLPANCELISGRNAVREALRAGRRVRRLLVVEGHPSDELVEDAIRLARELKLPVERVGRQLLEPLVPDHQGLAAVVSPFSYVGWGDLLARVGHGEKPPALLLLDTLHDPQNLGTLLRTAEAVGLDAVVLPKRRSVHVTPAVVRSSAGAVEHLAIAQVPNLVRAALDLKAAGVWIAGVDIRGDQLYWELDMTGPTALVLGGEDRGIGPLMRQNCDFLVRLPMVGQVNSLNASVAGSIVLYEMQRQRLGHPPPRPIGEEPVLTARPVRLGAFTT